MLPRIDQVQYDTRVPHLIDRANIHEWDLDRMISINRLPQNIRLIRFSNENLIPLVPLNAKNDRIYFQRYSSGISDELTNQSSPWLILKLQLDLKLGAEHSDAFISPWTNLHILNHKKPFHA